MQWLRVEEGGGGWPGVPLALDVPVSRVEGMALPGAVTYS